MAIKSDNLNLNLNLNLGAAASGAGASGGRARFNTEDFPKLARLPQPPTATDDNFQDFPAFGHRDEWDAENRAWAHLAEFVEPIAGGGSDRGPFSAWLTYVQSVLDGGPMAARCPAGPYKKMATVDDLNADIAMMVDLSLDRGDRLQEIVDQADGEGAINYWTGMLALNPAKQPNTHLLIRVGRKIGELVVMRLKDLYKCPRPSRIHPLLVPAIDPPDTPSYPSGHATQAYLISRLLIRAIDPGGAPSPPAHLKDGTVRRALKLLADRVAENRTVAGLHFIADNLAGEEVADKCLRRAMHCTSISNLVAAAAAEHA